MTALNYLNRIKLSDFVRKVDDASLRSNSVSRCKNEEKLDLVVELDYLGNLEVESKYLQASTIPWLIGQVKLFELTKRVLSVYMEISVKKNLLCVYKKSPSSSTTTSPTTTTINTSNTNSYSNGTNLSSSTTYVQNDELILKHNLTDIFKLTNLNSDPLCFAYFYRIDYSSFNYTLHAFSSNKSNLAQVLHDFQMQALKLHEHLQYEKIFDFKLVTKLSITQDELNIPNFIELCLEKAVDTSNFIKTAQPGQRTRTKTELYKSLLSDKRLLLKFGPNRVYLQETDQNPIEQGYKNVLYLNNSITNENFFCLAYSNSSDNGFGKIMLKKPTVNALILYSSNVELIDAVIKEYAVNVSSALNVTNNNDLLLNTKNKEIKCEPQYNQIKLEQHTCMLCPMQQFVELCEYLNTQNNSQSSAEKNASIINDILLDKLNYNLDQNDQNYLFDCLNSNNLTIDSYDNLIETNQLIVALLHKLCRKKQNQHLIDYIKRKSLTNSSADNNNITVANSSDSFTFLLVNDRLKTNYKHSMSLHNNLVNLNNNNNNNNINNHQIQNGSPDLRRKNRVHRSNTLDSTETKVLLEKLSVNMKKKSSKIVFKSKSSQFDILKTNDNSYSHNKIDSYINQNNSIRRYIFNKIVGTPAVNNNPSSVNSISDNAKKLNIFRRFKNRRDIVQFWKKIISEQIILIKMEKENRKLSLKAMARSQLDHKETNSSALNYIEITPCQKEVDKLWQGLLNDSETSDHVVDMQKIHDYVYKGVPQHKREKVWFWLIKQYKLRNPEMKPVIGEHNYEDLLKQTTIHQHAILLDLGRTFPSHANFSNRFGPGQLALFNVLKAYSIMDNEVGYCQGLSFIVGILLIHVNNDEEKAFYLLKFLLIDLNLREQYKPDMTQLQKHMYQFTRLLQETYNDIYSHLDENEISSSLYAAPWFLTLFSSQFQIGFVARVFDFLFSDGPIVLFKLSLSIMAIHKPILLSCDSFETIVNHIKLTIPEMSLIESELITNKAFSFELDESLNIYEIEFKVLHEEYSVMQNYLVDYSTMLINYNKNLIAGNQTKNSSDTKLESENGNLKKQVKDLNEKIQLLQLQIHNQDDLFYKLYHENNQLKCKVETLEIERNGILNKVKDQERLILNSMNLNK